MSSGSSNCSNPLSLRIEPPAPASSLTTLASDLKRTKENRRGKKRACFLFSFLLFLVTCFLLLISCFLSQANETTRRRTSRLGGINLMTSSLVMMASSVSSGIGSYRWNNSCCCFLLLLCARRSCWWVERRGGWVQRASRLEQRRLFQRLTFLLWGGERRRRSRRGSSLLLKKKILLLLERTRRTAAVRSTVHRIRDSKRRCNRSTLQISRYFRCGVTGYTRSSDEFLHCACNGRDELHKVVGIEWLEKLREEIVRRSRIVNLVKLGKQRGTIECHTVHQCFRMILRLQIQVQLSLLFVLKSNSCFSLC